MNQPIEACPHAFPSLDSQSGWDCLQCGGKGCAMKSIGVETRLQIYKPDTSPETIEQGLREGWIVPTRPTVSDSAKNQGFQSFSDSTIERDLTNSDSSPPTVSDSARNQGFQPLRGNDGRVTYFLDAERTTPITFPGPIEQDAMEPDYPLCEPFSNIIGPGFWCECGPYTSKGRVYYRYRWGKGHALLGVRHIPGGSLQQPRVQSRALAVYRGVYLHGKSHEQVLAMIDGWRQGGHHRQR